MTKKICSILATMTFFVMAAVTANAYDVNNHVYEAANGVGDAIVYPAYVAVDTVGTRIRVVNTSSRFSVVAKVVFREGTSSCETRDFLIYLTPNDVWYANITKTANGVTLITSQDESSPVVPLKVGMAKSCNGFDDSIGYVEVYEALAFDSFTLGGGAITGAMDKAILKAAYATILSDISSWTSTIGALDCDEEYASLSFKLDPASSDNYTAHVYRSKSVMAGWYRIGDGTGLKIEKRAVALAHNCNSVILNVQDETRWDNFGQNMPVEIRGALSKAFVHIPFNSTNASTFAVLNWPVKLSCCPSGSDYCDGVVSACDTTNNNGDLCLNGCEGISPTSWINNDCLHAKEAATTWAANGYDMEEHTMQSNPIFSPIPPSVNGPIPVEVYIADMTSFMGKDLTNGYAEGWVRLGLTDCDASRSGWAYDDTTYLVYDGSAVIPNFLDIDYDVALVAASYDCSRMNVYDDDNLTTATKLATFDNCSYQVISPDLWPTIVTP